MKNNMLKTLIKEEIKNILIEDSKPKSKNLDHKILELFFSVEDFTKNLLKYIDSSNKNKDKDAYEALEAAYDESKAMMKHLTTQLPKIKKELQDIKPWWK